MPIDFSPARWDTIKKTYSTWWDGTLGRPVISLQQYGRDPGRKMPATPLMSQSTCTDLSLPAKDIIDRIDYELSQIVYYGDSFPCFCMDCFGPGIVAAFCGAKIDNSSGRVWFHPEKVLPISELHFEYDGNNVWLQRIREICLEGMRYWQGQVLITMADLGGILDILSTFRTAENLLTDLYDEPEEVERLIWELHSLWHRFYQDINGALQPVNPGYSDWSCIFSSSPSYILQSDFSYMISPGMFKKFVLPELGASCRKLSIAFYHLDGVGQLAHLGSLLALPELAGIQWVPGDGKPDQSNWPEIYQKIYHAGKLTQLWNGFDCLDAVIAQTGDCRGIHMRAWADQAASDEDIRRRLERYGIS